MIRPVSQKPLLFPSAVFVLGLCVAYALLPSSLAACALCIGFPEKTVADQLLAFHCALLARNTAENAFSYSPVLELKGEYDGSEIELLGDSRTRRVLSSQSNRHVLLVQKERNGKWSSLGIVNDKFSRGHQKDYCIETTMDGPKRPPGSMQVLCATV